jgi:hypothetical protein
LSQTRYRFSNGISGFFEFPTEAARRILPPHLEPVEPHHGTSVFQMTAFDFTESEVGHYGEVVMAVVVVPLVKPGERLPKAALYPYRVATTTAAARAHAIERWHLPHWMEDIGLEFHRDGAKLTARTLVDGQRVAELTVTEHTWETVSHLYQSFMKDDQGRYLARMVFDGQLSEHEEETGSLVLHEHPFNRELPLGDVSEFPFREVWMRDGLQTFDPLISL